MTDLALETAVARAYADALRASLHHMADTTRRHGSPPDADALLAAIKHALDRASAVSIEAGVALLTAREEGVATDKARASAAGEGGEAGDDWLHTPPRPPPASLVQRSSADALSPRGLSGTRTALQSLFGSVR